MLLKVKKIIMPITKGHLIGPSGFEGQEGINYDSKKLNDVIDQYSSLLVSDYNVDTTGFHVVKSTIGDLKIFNLIQKFLFYTIV